MNSKTFHYSSPKISPHVIDSFTGTRSKKDLFLEMINEWNLPTSISQLSQLWEKDRPRCEKQNLAILLFNVADVDSLLASYHPHICILTGVGTAVYRSKDIIFPEYNMIAQPTTNSFGGVMILNHSSIKCKVVERALNLIWIEIDQHPNPIYVGAIYVPPGYLLPFHLISKY